MSTVARTLNARSFSLAEGFFVEDARVSSKRDFRLTIRLPFLREWLPGQFVMLRWGNHLIGRPFAIVSWKAVKKNEARGAADSTASDSASVLEVWVRRLGGGTEELASYARKGAPVWVTAPLGQGLSKQLQASKLIFVSGGVGAASLYPLVKARASKGDYWIHGERESAAMDRELLEDQARPQLFYFEDEGPITLPKGSLRQSGRVTQAFENLPPDPRLTESFDGVVACGPSAMLEALNLKLKSSRTFAHLPLHLGLEEKMACGIGLCFSCSVSTQEGLKRCCLEGPWFEASELKAHFNFRKTGQL